MSDQINSQNPPVNPPQIFFNPDLLNSMAKQANLMQDDLRPYQVNLNKVNMSCSMIASVLAIIQKVLLIILPAWYFVAHVICTETTQKVLDFIIAKTSDWTMLLIICSTLVALSFIKKKYK